MKREFAALGLLAGALLGAHPAAADTLVDHVHGRTLDAQGHVERFTGMVIAPDGRVARLLHEGEERPTRPDYVLDGHDAALIPGLVVSHLRLMPLALDSIAPPQAKRPLPPPRPEDRDLALASIQPRLLAQGITAVADMGTTIEDWQTYRRAGDLGQLNIRIVSFADSIANMVLIAGSGPTPWLYEDRLRLNGLLVDTGGSPKPSIIQIKNRISRAGMDHFQVVVRLEPVTPSRTDEVTKAMAELAETYQGDRRWTVATAPASLPLPTPLAGLPATVRTQTLDSYGPAAAQGLFAETRFGRVAKGFWADFVLLDADPLDVNALAPRPLSTWIAGRMVWQAETPRP
ncbi:hypothetical protein EOE18_00685 [Novosphingobium umbonatum]|uniref:Amidohydrolase-related domain-containing protein n=1 Tax=Novosphingobium umbonatum TaxID=1908524 RepID=A0A437NCL2_9SPHN|nr:hypothetical protein [Novosphingobium umbonatum]RVU07640.1 hypothetical protein EOE18_00685 [Novosphingobium umbonatum]